MISVVMATYNGEKYLSEQLESICKQTVKPDELIISDDCSTDNTRRIVSDLKQNTTINIRLFENARRLGYSANFKKALKAANGEYIFFSDQDDVWKDNKIEDCLKIMKKNSGIYALSTSYEVVNENLKHIHTFEDLPKKHIKKIAWKEFLRHPKYPGMAMVFKKELISEIDEKEWTNDTPHDWIINQHASRRDGLYKISNKLVLYRQHKDNAVGIAVINKTGINVDRISIIDSILQAISGISVEENDKEIFRKNMVEFLNKRIDLLKKRKTFSLFTYEILKCKYITLRSILGDMITLFGSNKGE